VDQIVADRAVLVVGAGVIAIGVAVSFIWLPGLAIALLALPFLYIAAVLTLVTHRLGPRGGDLQRRIHQLLIDEVGVGGRLLDVGCGSGQLLIRCAKSGPGEFVGLDYWGDDWEYSKAQPSVTRNWRVCRAWSLCTAARRGCHFPMVRSPAW
jgi:SAM-dependent methyltransferase